MRNLNASMEKTGTKIRYDDVDLEKGSSGRTKPKPKLGITVPQGPVAVGPPTAKPSVWTKVFGKD